MKNAFSRLLARLSRRRASYEPLIAVEISADAILHNLNEFKRLAPKPAFAPEGAVAPVLKSNAYGHGLEEVARLLERQPGIPFFVVDSYFEALALRRAGITTPLLIIGYTRPETIAASRLKDVSFTITCIETLRTLAGSGTQKAAAASLRRPVRLHLKIDTGMHRQGILPEEIGDAITLLSSLPKTYILEGICSHLCDSDNADPAFTERQISLWNSLAGRFRAAFPAASFPDFRYIHLSATDGHRLSDNIDANVSRLGIGLYGLSETAALTSALDLRPALEMKTILTGIKPLRKGESIGYGASFTAPRDMTVATIPVGYFEGLDRRLSYSNSPSSLSASSTSADGGPKGFVLVGPERAACPIIGRISMNIASIDVSAVLAAGATVGTEAVVISARPADPNSIVSIARACGSISYEGAVKIPAHLKRVMR